LFEEQHISVVPLNRIEKFADELRIHLQQSARITTSQERGGRANTFV
jgi:hypothetical protein